jgi:hypothetical protein
VGGGLKEGYSIPTDVYYILCTCCPEEEDDDEEAQ